MSTGSPPPTSPLAPKKKGERSAWTKEQVEALKAAVAEFEATHPGGAGRGKWKAIAANVPDRNDAQCRQRWEDSTKEGRKEGTWSNAEDNALRIAVEDTKHVTWRRWTMVAEKIPKRTAKQCEYRYKNHLAPKSGAGADPHGNAGLGLMADVTMNQHKLRPFATMLQPHSGAQSFLMPATMPSPAPAYVDAGTKESLMTAIQRLQPLLTKTSVAAYPSHILDLAVQCIAALPAETSAVVAEVQKLRYILADQRQYNMPPPMMHPSYAQTYAQPSMQPPSMPPPPLTAKPVAEKPGWTIPTAYTVNPTRASENTINARYPAASHSLQPAATSDRMPSQSWPPQNASFAAVRTNLPANRLGELVAASENVLPATQPQAELPLLSSGNARPRDDMNQPVTFPASSQAHATETEPNTPSTTPVPDLPRSTGNEKTIWNEPASFGTSASASANGIRVMPAITPAPTDT